MEKTPPNELDQPPLGILPNGELNVVKKDDPRFEPELVVDDEEEDDDDLSDLDDLATL
jgi:hypothetical protein